MENRENLQDLSPVLIGVTVGLTYQAAVRFFLNGMRLKRMSKYKSFTVQPVPSELYENTNQKLSNHLIKMEYFKCLKIFLKVIKENVPNAKLDAFYKNAKNLEFEKLAQSNRFKLFNYQRIVASYSSAQSTKNHKNKITFVASDDICKSIYHELLHMASTRFQNDRCFVGFLQYDKNKINSEIGRGLNEGYTALLTNRYFSEYGAESYGYPLCTYIAIIIEIIVGKEKMQEWYFSSDLYSLANELQSFTPENIIALIKKIDIVNEYCSKIGFTKVSKELYREIIRTLTTIALERLSSLPTLTLEQHFFILRLRLLSTEEIKYGNTTFSAFTDEEIRELINKYDLSSPTVYFF